MFHVDAGNYMEVRTCHLKGINHIVGYIRAKASLSIYPPVGKAPISAPTHIRVEEIYAQTLEISGKVSDSVARVIQKGHAVAIRDR
jgi:hypothetical protein